MIIQLQINGQICEIDSAKPLSLAIPLDFYGAQPNAYAVERASSKPFETENLVGDTRRGGSCNFEQITFIPHCNGTHTECAGHITHQRISVHECLRDVFMTAKLISAAPENALETDEKYSFELNENDFLITRRAIENALAKDSLSMIKNPQSLVVRTLPNAESRLSRVYLDEIPPFFSTDAMLLMREIGIEHLLVDVPSIDRIYDGGKLSNHRIFWNVASGEFEINAESLINNTITELIYAADKIADGDYLLNLQIAPFAADAAPSRPILFRLVR